MKFPVKIGSIGEELCNQPHHHDLFNQVIDSNLDVSEMKSDDPIRVKLKEICKEYGLKFASQCYNYDEYKYLYGVGSALSHVDYDLGLVVSAFVATANTKLFECELICFDECTWNEEGNEWSVKASKAIIIEVGDVFVFNANYMHIWVADCSWVLAQQCVEVEEHV